MRSIAWTLTFAAGLGTGFAPAQDSEAIPADRRLQELLDKLGSDDPAVRESASRELTRLGEKWIDALRRLAKASEDPEVRARARGVLNAIQQGSALTREKLRTVSAGVAMEEGSLSDLLAAISQKTGIQFLLHFREADCIDTLADVDFRNVSLEAALDSIASAYELAWGIDAEQRVFLMPRGAYFARFAETRVIDVAAIVDPPRDRSPDGAGEDPMSREELVHLLTQSIEPDSWHNENVWLNVDGGRLKVRHLPEVVLRVEQMVAELRAKLARPVKVELMGILCDSAKLRAWIRSDGRDPTSEPMQSLLAKAAGEEEGKRFAWLQLSAANGRGVRGVHSYESTFVTGFHADKSGERSLVLPVTNVVSEGMEAFVRARVSENGRRASVDMGVKATRIVETETVKTEAGEVRLPKVASMEFKQTVDLAHDRWEIVGVGSPAGKPELRMVLLARVSIGQ